jgi:dTMP kinase
VPGLFVTFEGGEGSGKSTQVAALAARLRAHDVDPLVTREPGGTPLAEGIRALLLDPERRPVPLAEAFLMQASRAQLVETLLRPALEQGRVVLCDRYDDSTLAYQGAGRGLDARMLADWNRAATRSLVPDLTLLFDLAPEAGSTNRLDREPTEFHARVRARYLELAAADPARWIVLNAVRPAAELESQVWGIVAPRLGLPTA